MKIDIKRINEIITLLLFVLTSILWFFQKLPLLSFLLIIGYFFILGMTIFYQWNITILLNCKVDKHVQLGYIINIIRNIFIFFPIFTILLTFIFNETNVDYPAWQNSYIIHRYSKTNEIEEHQPYKILLDSLKQFPELKNEKASLLSSRSSKYIYFYKGSIINDEMIQDAMDNYNKYVSSLCLLSFLLLSITISLDYIVSGLYTPKISSDKS